MAESEADTPSTPIEFESKYFEFDGVRLPPFCRGKMEEIADFSLRSSDIWLVTYPKSGPSLPACVSRLVHVALPRLAVEIDDESQRVPSSVTNSSYSFFDVPVDHNPVLFVIIVIPCLFLCGLFFFLKRGSIHSTATRDR